MRPAPPLQRALPVSTGARSHTRAHTLSLIYPERRSWGGRGEPGLSSGAGSREAREALPSHPKERPCPRPPGWCQGGAHLLYPGNTCSHFYQGMLMRQQQVYSESAFLREWTADFLHLYFYPGPRRLRSLVLFFILP